MHAEIEGEREAEGESERDLKSLCLAMRSNEQTASSCPNGEYSLLNFAQPNKIGNISSDSQMSMTWKRVFITI